MKKNKQNMMLSAGGLRLKLNKMWTSFPEHVFF